MPLFKDVTASVNEHLCIRRIEVILLKWGPIHFLNIYQQCEQLVNSLLTAHMCSTVITMFVFDSFTVTMRNTYLSSQKEQNILIQTFKVGNHILLNDRYIKKFRAYSFCRIKSYCIRDDTYFQLLFSHELLQVPSQYSEEIHKNDHNFIHARNFFNFFFLLLAWLLILGTYFQSYIIVRRLNQIGCFLKLNAR